MFKSPLMLVVKLILHSVYKLGSLMLNINDFINIITAHAVETDSCCSDDALNIV